MQHHVLPVTRPPRSIPTLPLPLKSANFAGDFHFFASNPPKFRRGFSIFRPQKSAKIRQSPRGASRVLIHCRRRQCPRGGTSSLSFATALETVAILLLADADELEEIAALAVVQLAFSAFKLKRYLTAASIFIISRNFQCRRIQWK